MKIIPICPDSYGANTYLLISGSYAFAVDAAVSVSAIDRALETCGASLCGMLLTHGHFDHTVSADTLRRAHSVPLMIHKGDAPMLTDGKINGFFDFYGKECVHSPAEQLLSRGDMIQLGNELIRVIHTPGHSPGSVCFLCTDDGGKDFLLTGDTLFSNSVGRCDLWQGDEEQLRYSLQALAELPRSLHIYPGHGPDASLGYALDIAKYYIDF